MKQKEKRPRRQSLKVRWASEEDDPVGIIRKKFVKKGKAISI